MVRHNAQFGVDNTRHRSASHRHPGGQNALTHLARIAARLLSAPLAIAVVDDGTDGLDTAYVGMTEDDVDTLLDTFSPVIAGGGHGVVRAEATHRLHGVDSPPEIGGEPIRFVAAVSVVAEQGAGVGSIWGFDTDYQRGVEESQRRDLTALADLLRDELEMRRANRDLEDARREMATILRVLPDALVFADPTRHITSVNDAFSARFGYSAEEARDRTTEFLYARPKDFEKTQIRYNPDAPDQTEPYQIEYRRRDGATFLGETIGVHVRDDEGQTLGYLGITRDVTESERLKQDRRDTVEKLRRNEELLRETNRMAKVGGGTFDHRSDTVTWSEELYRIHDLPVGQPLSQQQTLEYFEPHDRRKLKALTEEVIDRGESFEVELPINTAAGRRRWVRIKGSPMVEDGKIVGVQGYYQDITEQKQAAEAKREFISVVSHELRTPLTSIRGMISLVANEVVGELPDEARDMLMSALKNTERLGALIDDILDIEKIEAGKIDLKIRPIDIADVLGEVVETSHQFAADADVTLRIGRSLPPLQIYADGDKLHQVLTNLVSNAIKYSPPDEIVEISCREVDADMVRIAVRDRGPGIPVEFREKLFDKFSRADTSDRRQRQGTGLGLSIARRITEQMGGDIGFDTAIGEGTTMYIDMPIYSGLEEGRHRADGDL